MKNLIAMAGLFLGTVTLFAQKSTSATTQNPIFAEKKIDANIEGNWKINKINGKVVKNELTKTFGANGVLITKVGTATKKTKWKIENEKLCINEIGDDFVCCDYKIIKNILTYTIEGMELSYLRK